jgi:hypothetical protein
MFQRNVVVALALVCLVASAAYGQIPVTKVVPQIALGSFDGGGTEYEIAFFVMNLHTAPITISANFYNRNGSPSFLRYDRYTDITQDHVPFSGTMPATTIPVGGMIFIDGDSPGSGVINWASFTANGNFSVATVILVGNNVTGKFETIVGVPASAPDMRAFMFPRVFDPELNADVGFALVNTGNTPATVTATLRDMTGSVIVSKDQTLASTSQIAIYMGQFFGSTFTQSERTQFATLTMSSNSPQFAATALFIASGILTTLPVEKLQ